MAYFDLKQPKNSSIYRGTLKLKKHFSFPVGLAASPPIHSHPITTQLPPLKPPHSPNTPQPPILSHSNHSAPPFQYSSTPSQNSSIHPLSIFYTHKLFHYDLPCHKLTSLIFFIYLLTFSWGMV